MILDVAEKLMEHSDITFISIGIEFVIVAFCWFFAVQFYSNIKRRKEYELRNDTALIWLVFFIFQGLSYSLGIFANYFQNHIPNFLSRNYLLNISGAIGLIGVILIARKSEQILKDYYIVTIVLSLFSIFPMVFYFFPALEFRIFQMIAYGAAILLFFTAVRYETGEHPILKKQLRFFIFGFLLMVVCQLARSDVILNILFAINEDLVYDMMLFGDIGLLLSLFLLQYTFIEFPSLFELEWRKFMTEVHVIYLKSGVEVFSHYFKGLKKDSSEITGGFLFGVNQLISEITGSETPLNMIKQEENVIVFEKNDKLIVFLIASEYNEIYVLKLQKLLNQIMHEFGHILEDWKGEMTPLKPIKEIIRKIF